MKDLFKGFISQNPVFCLILGLCPTLAITTSVSNALGMGCAVILVLLGSNTLVSILKNVVPSKIRNPCFIIVIATFVTIVDMSMKAFFPAISKSLGMFIPLIVVNCVPLARAEAFASKNGVFKSMIDALAIGMGYTFALTLISIVRELLGGGAVLGFKVWNDPMLAFLLAPGAFFTLGLWFSLFKKVKNKAKPAH